MTSATALAGHQIHVWYHLTEDVDDLLVSRSLAWLSYDEQLRYARHRQAADRRDFALAHALLRSSLSYYGGAEPNDWTFTTGLYGKPALTITSGASANLTFSLTHTRGCVACAIGRGPEVGIDAERTDFTFDCLAVASQYFDSDDLARLKRCPAEDRRTRFAELWTIKEARGKASGVGLSEAAIGPEPYQVAVFAVQPHYRLGVAVAVGTASPVTITARNLEDGSETRGYRPV